MRVAKLAGLALVSAALMVAGCSRGHGDNEQQSVINEADVAPPEPNNVAVAPAEQTEAPPPVTHPAANAAESVAPPPAPAPQVTNQQQIQDDADATGLTARIPDNDGSAPANEAEVK